MAEKNSYVTVLIESLQKKIAVLDMMIQKNLEQNIIISKERMNLEDFEDNTSAKMDLIQELERLDTGFEMIYDKVKPELTGQQDLYKEEIAVLQELIKSVTDRSMNIQVSENRNKQIIEQHFRFERQELHKSASATKAANTYFKSMNGTNMSAPYMVDQKK